jgi:hypothetical protein
MYQPVAGGVLRAERLADGRRRSQPLDKPGAIDRRRLAVLQYSDPNG